MPDYRRLHRNGGTFFLTVVTFHRRILFADEANVARLRGALQAVRAEQPFTVEAAVILPDHLHYIWTLPVDDTDYSRRIGRMKVLFTQSLPDELRSCDRSGPSQPGYSTVWQPRFWEHTVRDTDDFKGCLDYVHYNPVKHGLVKCPHAWPYSSFRKWVERGVYDADWYCVCRGNVPLPPPDFSRFEGEVGE